MKKKIIHDVLFKEDPADFLNGDLHIIIETLQQIQAKALAKGITSVTMYTCIEGSDDYVESETQIGGNRIETDDEYKIRKTQEKEAKKRAAQYQAQKEREEKALYIKLKKKYAKSRDT